MKLNKLFAKKPVQNESGFTLLEILAVLVILGILSVVALPKYFNLQANARDKAMAAGKAEVIGRINGFFAQQVLAGVDPGTITYTDVTLDFANFGSDFVASVASGPTEDPILVDLTAAANSSIAGGSIPQISVPRPGL